jgi:alpha-N-arabinofuranosidase
VPTYETEIAGDVPYLDIAGVHDEGADTLTFFAVNRHPTRDLTTQIALQGFGAPQVIDHQVMTHPDLHAVNNKDNPDRIVPRRGSGATIEDGSVRLVLPPNSWQMLRLKV